MKRNAIALTGGIGSGKSAVGNYLRENGFVVIDCDKLSRQISTEPQVLQQVAQLLGDDFVVNGELNRAKIRNVVFADKILHQKYSQIFFQRIKQLLIQTMEQTNGVVFVEIPLMDAFQMDWQQIWLVERDVQSRVDSVTKRDNVSAQNVLDIISKQQAITNYTVKIDNNGTLDELYKQVETLLANCNLR